jgi:hypothetical protein
MCCHFSSPLDLQKFKYKLKGKQQKSLTGETQFVKEIELDESG